MIRKIEQGLAGNNQENTPEKEGKKVRITVNGVLEEFDSIIAAQEYMKNLREEQP